jgi:protein subunit release factor B
MRLKVFKMTAQTRASFKVTHADCEFTFTKGGGPGGQNVNKRNTKCRCFHKPSGATGVSADERSAEQNKRTAFVRMAHTDTFQKWTRLEAARLSGRLAEAEDAARAQLAPHNIRLEVKAADGRWQRAALDAPLDDTPPDAAA